MLLTVPSPLLMKLQSFKHKEFVTALAYHPIQQDIFLSGGARSGIACWDSRSNRFVEMIVSKNLSDNVLV